MRNYARVTVSNETLISYYLKIIETVSLITFIPSNIFYFLFSVVNRSISKTNMVNIDTFKKWFIYRYIHMEHHTAMTIGNGYIFEHNVFIPFAGKVQKLLRLFSVSNQVYLYLHQFNRLAKGLQKGKYIDWMYYAIKVF